MPRRPRRSSGGVRRASARPCAVSWMHTSSTLRTRCDHRGRGNGLGWGGVCGCRILVLRACTNSGLSRAAAGAALIVSHCKACLAACRMA